MRKKLPYGKQTIDKDDIKAVTKALKNEIISGCGPITVEFEKKFSNFTNAKYSTACSSGTSALHLSLIALGIGPGDHVIVPTITFLATANAVKYVGADIIFSDVDSKTGNITPTILENIVNNNKTKKIKAAIIVHLNGHIVEMDKIKKIAIKFNLKIIEDACHALGGAYQKNEHSYMVGSCKYSDLSTFSFHPVKAIAMGEGGVITTNNKKFDFKMKQIRNHGIIKDPKKFVNKKFAYTKKEVNSWYYEMHEIGFNFRVSEINCALGNSQLNKLKLFINKRKKLASYYKKKLMPLKNFLEPIEEPTSSSSAWHLFVVLLDFQKIHLNRNHIVKKLKDKNILTQVHYIPVHTQPFYQSSYANENFPSAMSYYNNCLSLPLYPLMKNEDIDYIVDTIKSIFNSRKEI